MSVGECVPARAGAFCLETFVGNSVLKKHATAVMRPPKHARSAMPPRRQLASKAERKSAPSTGGVKKPSRSGPHQQVSCAIQVREFNNLVHEVLKEVKDTHPTAKIQPYAIVALQEASESYIIELFEEAKRCAKHAKRATVTPKDIQLGVRMLGKGL